MHCQQALPPREEGIPLGNSVQEQLESLPLAYGAGEGQASNSSPAKQYSPMGNSSPYCCGVGGPFVFFVFVCLFFLSTPT